MNAIHAGHNRFRISFVDQCAMKFEIEFGVGFDSPQHNGWINKPFSLAIPELKNGASRAT